MKYSEKHQVNFYECDENENLKLQAMIDLMMSTSEHQLNSDAADTISLNERGLGWVVTQYHIEIIDLPHPNEQLTITTNPVGYNRFLEYRDFAINNASGKEIVKMNSEWVLFDLHKRKLVSTDSDLMAKIGVPLLKKMPRFPRLRVQQKYQENRSYRVRYDDLDTNHHMTNSHYFNWFIDSLERDFLKQNMIQTIDIKFNQEVRYGQRPQVLVSLVNEGNNFKSYHAIADEERKDKAVCELIWRKL
jgi:medium-chain acyl-[acyl-carrier-protein] hydrolase